MIAVPIMHFHRPLQAQQSRELIARQAGDRRHSLRKCLTQLVFSRCPGIPRQAITLRAARPPPGQRRIDPAITIVFVSFVCLH